MKKLILACLSIFFYNVIASQNTYIPNNNFEQAIINLGLDTGFPNDSVPTANIDTLTFLDVSSKLITDLTGIEDFNDLAVLKCHSNLLQNIDISQNLLLKELWCHNNQLATLNITFNTLLEVLVCSKNNISNLNFAQNTALDVIDVIGNPLGTIDVSQNNLLSELWCGNNQLNTLDVTNNPNLKILWCTYNQLSNLDVSANPLLEKLLCDGNNLTALDVTQNLMLDQLHCKNNLLTSLNVTNNTQLLQLTCDTNQLSSINLSNNLLLKTFHCKSNNITSLDVSNNTNLYNFVCNDNKLTSLNVKNSNNANFFLFGATFNPNLNCIKVDDPIYSNSNWSLKDSHCIFSSNCFPLSVKNNENSAKTFFYPNPATHFITINNSNKIVEVKIIDITGKVYKTTIENNNRIDISNLSNGIYFVETTTSNGKSIEKLIKQ